MTQSVLFFDSGVGGLSVLQQVRLHSPHLNLRYVMDDAAFPYGTKSDDVLTQRVQQVCFSAVQQCSPDILVIACNTASTLALPALRQALDIPVVGVVPAIKPAAQLAQRGHIGLLATPATVERLYINDLIQDFAEHCNVDRLGSSELVQWAEDYLASGQPVPQLQAHLQPWFERCPEMTHVVLGCTHFPLLKPQLQQLWPDIHWIDSGEAIARRVASLLHQSRKLQKSESEKHSPEAHSGRDGELSLHWTSANLSQPAAQRFLLELGELTEATQLALHTADRQNETKC